VAQQPEVGLRRNEHQYAKDKGNEQPFDALLDIPAAARKRSAKYVEAPANRKKSSCARRDRFHENIQDPLAQGTFWT